MINMSEINQNKKKSRDDVKVSIGIPVHNGEKFIQKKLDSLLKQTHTNFEIIISDNASTDSTATICKDYQKKDSRIKYILQKRNLGVHKNYETLLENASGDYFLFAQVDNYFSATFLEKCAEILDSNPNVVGCISKISIDKQYIDPFKKEKEILKNMGLRFRTLNPIPISGTYENRIKEFLEFLKKDYDTKYVAIIAHKAPQLALEVLLKEKTWRQAIDKDWRNKKAWQPGWEYTIK